MLNIRLKTFHGGIEETYKELLSSTTHPKSIVKIHKLYNGLLYIGATYGHKEWFFLDKKERIRLFGETNDLNKKPEYREFIRKGIQRRSVGNNLKKECSSYYITDELIELTKQHLLKQECKPSGINILGDVNIQLNLPIKSLNDALNTIKLNADTDFKQCIRNLNSAHKMFIFGTENDDYIDFNVPYTNDKHGRMHSVFTNMSKQFRNLLFNGFWDIDIDAAMPTLISQYVKQNFDVDMPETFNYINNKTAIRQNMATKLGVDIGIIKKLYNMPFFNGIFPSIKQLNHSYKEYKMTELVGADNIVLLHNDVDWCNYIKEINQIKKLFKQINTKISSTYFELERRILNTILSQTGLISVVPIHDGFIINQKIDSKGLISVIKEKTGYEVNLSQKQIGKKQ